MSRAARALEAASKITVLLSAAAALVAQGWLASYSWPGFLWWIVAAFVAGFALTRWLPAVGWAAVMVSLYLSPVLFLGFSGRHVNADYGVWMGGCLGAVMAAIDWRAWQYAARWRWPLAYWALAVALVWPFIVWREVDFVWPLLSKYTPYRLANSGLGGPPAVITLWITGVVLIHLLGLLWFDTASADAGGERRFRAETIRPLALGAAVACLLAVYQGTIDLHFLNGHQWPALNRAGGSLVDGDAFGALAGMWALGFLAWAAGAWGRRVAAAGVIGAILAWGALWATGSRTALATALVGAALGAFYALSARLRSGAAIPWRGLGVASVAVTICIVAMAKASSARDPLERLIAMRETAAGLSVTEFAVAEFWNRHAPFGTVSMMMLGAHPVTGVGVGSFHHLFPDFAYALTGWNRHFFDNAQSWYRHQLAELGWLGSLGWMFWIVAFLPFVLRARDDRRPLEASALRGALLAIGLICLVSMPTQNLAVAMTFWIFCAWYLHASRSPAVGTRPSPLARFAGWSTVWILAALFAGLSFEEGLMKLRVPYRAIAADWPYTYGFEEADENGLRWTSLTRAVRVANVEHRQWVWDGRQYVPPPAGTPTPQWVRLTISGAPPDAASNRFGFELRVDRRLVADEAFFDGRTRTWYFELRPGQSHTLIEIETTRLWRPAAAGAADPRQLGVALHELSFVPAPPPGAEAFPLLPTAAR